MEERFEQTEKRVDQHGELIAELRAATLKNSQNMDRLILNSEQHGEQLPKNSVPPTSAKSASATTSSAATKNATTEILDDAIGFPLRT
jgi:hypothetical protein